MTWGEHVEIARVVVAVHAYVQYMFRSVAGRFRIREVGPGDRPEASYRQTCEAVPMGA